MEREASCNDQRSVINQDRRVQWSSRCEAHCYSCETRLIKRNRGPLKTNGSCRHAVEIMAMKKKKLSATPQVGLIELAICLAK